MNRIIGPFARRVVRHCGVPVLLITGGDESILADELTTRIHEAVGGADRSLVLDDFDADQSTDDETATAVRSAVDAASTAGLFSDHRVVVLRHINEAKVEFLAPLVEYLAAPVESTHLILTASGAVAKSVLDALKKAGGTTVSTSVGDKAKERELWFREQLDAAGLRLDPAAVAAAVSRIGGDVGRLPGIIDTLVSTHGTSRKLTVDDVTPFLGQAGMVPVYELANEIDKGDARGALVILHRMLDAGEMHALQVLRVLHNHFERLLRLDGADVAGPREAMDLLGLKSKSDYPGQKALEQLGRLGSDGVRDAIQLIAEADVHLRGGRDWPPELVMEVLVARLARLSGRRKTSRR